MPLATKQGRGGGFTIDRSMSLPPLNKASGADAPMGGIANTGGQAPDHAVFYILVADIDTTCADAEQLGGLVVSKHLDPGPGAPTFAYLRDPAGNLFGVFTPPAA